MKKILMLCPTSNSVKNFRLPLIRKFKSEGYQVGVCVFDEDNRELIENIGVDFFCIPSRNRSLNPFHFLKQKNSYKKLIKEYQPDVVFTFVLKPNTIGVMAAHSVGVKEIYSMVEGLGDVFTNNTLKWRIVRHIVCRWYKKSLKLVKKVFFLNVDDRAEFISRKLALEEKCQLIKGVGVDLERFEQKPIKNHSTFLMISRMIKAKGVFEYCECARIVKQKYPNVVFNYLGAEGPLKLMDIQEYIDDGSINYLGTTKDVRPYIQDCGIFVLPSYYREGLPMSIMEAEAVGRAVITCDNVGCRDTVVNGYNGFLIPKGDVQELVKKVIWMLENPKEVVEIGCHSRKYAEENFNQEKINEIILNTIQNGDIVRTKETAFD